MQAVSLCVSMFQHTAARRRLGSTYQQIAADQSGFNTQPPEGGWVARTSKSPPIRAVSTHSRPKAAGRPDDKPDDKPDGFNTQPPEGGWLAHLKTTSIFQTFQHTAARRRLARTFVGGRGQGTVSTHSRPKAAGLAAESAVIGTLGFNTQPPEGGW